jgi:hypothetical protein
MQERALPRSSKQLVLVLTTGYLGFLCSKDAAKAKHTPANGWISQDWYTRCTVLTSGKKVPSLQGSKQREDIAMAENPTHNSGLHSRTGLRGGTAFFVAFYRNVHAAAPFAIAAAHAAFASVRLSWCQSLRNGTGDHSDYSVAQLSINIRSAA